MDEKLRQLLRRVSRIEIRARSSVGDLGAGLYRSRFRGQGMEFDRVRDYVPGDDVRHIDWNVTARAGKPYIKTFREERELSIMILTDSSGSMHFGAVPGISPQTKLVSAAEAAAVIAITALRNNDRVGLMAFTDRTEFQHRCRRGRNHVMRLLRDLLAFEPPPRATDVGLALEELRRVHHRHTITFLISDFINPHPDLARALQRVRRKHEVIGVRVTDPAEERLPTAPLPLVLQDPEGRALRVLAGGRRAARRYRHLWEQQTAAVGLAFASAGCDLIDCRTDASTYRTIRDYFRRRRSRVRA